MNFFEQQLRAILGNEPAFKNARYIGRACYVSLDGGNKLKAEFITLSTADHYEALKLTAINPRDGEIDRLTLRFSDHFKRQAVHDYTAVPYIWTYGKDTEWYARPSIEDKTALGDAAQEYAEQFEQKNDMEFSM